jgi:hypothetical protein
MADTLTYLGGQSIGACIPGVMASVSIGKLDLEARIGAMLQWKPGAITIGAQIALCEQILADLKLGVVPPSIDAQIAIMATTLAGLMAQLNVILQFYNLCAAAGVDAWWYDGTAAGLGGTLAAATAGGMPSGGNALTHSNGLVLATTLGATATAMGQIFITP